MDVVLMSKHLLIIAFVDIFENAVWHNTIIYD